MKTHHYAREETDTFDEVNKVFNELRNEIVGDFDENVKKSKVVDDVLTELSSRIAKLEKPPLKKPIQKKAKKKAKKK